MVSDWITVFESSDTRRGEEFALVLEALSIRWRLDRGWGGCVLQVPEPDAPRAAKELEAFKSENVGWPPAKEALPAPFPFAIAGSFVFGSVILLLFGFEARGTFGQDWWHYGKTSADLIMKGEWWRTITALTLHSDVVHLAGNVCFGMLFGYFVSRDLGVGLGWFTILLSGAIGNGLNAALQVPAHTSVGASTAIFGAVGILASYGTVRRILFKERGFRRWAPFIIAWIFLGFLGAGGERTDVLAHIMGLLSGLGLGLALGLASPHLSSGRAYQWWMGACSLALVIYAWIRALPSS